MYDISDFIKHYTKNKLRSSWAIYYKGNRVVKYIIIDKSQTKKNKVLKLRAKQEIDMNKYLLKNKNKLVNTLIPLKTGLMTNKQKLPYIGYYILLEKMDGSLEDLNDKRINWNPIMLQILLGIKSLNKINVFHNDLAPRNIFFKKLDTPSSVKTYKLGTQKYVVKKVKYDIKIADFGLSRIVDAKSKSKSLKNNVAYLTSTLAYNTDYRTTPDKKFKLSPKLKEKFTGIITIKKLYTISRKKKKFSLENPTFEFTKKDVYLYLKTIVKPNKIIKDL